MKSFLSSFPRNQKVSLLLLGATHICYACMYVCMHTDTCGLTDSSMLCLWISIFFSTGCPQNKLKQKNYLPQRQIMSLAEKADTAAVSFCLNSIFFFLTVHMEKVLWAPLKIKGFAHLKALPVCTVPTSIYLLGRSEFPSAQAVWSQRKLFSPQTHKTRPSKARPRALLNWCLGLDKMNC